jgi:hypothetical protein
MSSPESGGSAVDPTEQLTQAIRRWGLILWPSFMAACLLEFLVFAIVDPTELQWPDLLGKPSSLAVYTVAFFAFWLVCALCSRAVLWLADSDRPGTPMELSGTPED